MIKTKTKKTAVITINGVQFDIINPDPNLIKISDIAMSLSNICRFGGLIENHYSVATHSLNVAKCIEDAGHDKSIVLAGLLHDASETYCGDLTSPFKAYMGKRYRDVEHNLELAICKKFNVDLFTYKPIIKKYDTIMYNLENNCLKNGYHDPRIRCVDPKVAREEFLEKYWELTR